MSATGLEVFDKTLQTSNTWLGETMDEIGPDRELAWHALGAVLHGVRDWIPAELAVHLGAQLPLLVRGLYYDRWRLVQKPERGRSQHEFIEHVSGELTNQRSVNRVKAIQAVFNVLSRHVSAGQLDKVRQALPEDVRALWPITEHDRSSSQPVME
ncbi:DUF2267 domain-containing protein [Microvirga terricola]|uniref:DUF2267 domain-containing protein n=1 Tax=Microvirga terricola TaxID=2719797 RepID=A0ABX0V7U9_9HYPH|nr:DUF2267 domain-containing protein [Microvirga terricola]NIX75036.1 DUF2267 domain-containing protein [Microvirga terricola]